MTPSTNIFRRNRDRRISPLLLVASLIGLSGFLYPFLLPALARVEEQRAHAADAPYLFALITVCCIVAVAFELEQGAGRGSASKSVALLGVLVAIDATLRLVPSFLGGSPIFLLVILVGAVFGPAFGFQMGSLTLLVSAFITGGIGPWLPYQMLGVGWIGLTAGWLPRPRSMRRRLLILAAFGAVWGLLYGALLNLWSWPFAAPGLEGDVGLYWTPDLSLAETLHHYGAYYLTTSLWYDAFRAIGNAVLVMTLGGPILSVLDRFYARFTWEPWREWDEANPEQSRGSDRPMTPVMSDVASPT